MLSPVYPLQPQFPTRYGTWLIKTTVYIFSTKFFSLLGTRRGGFCSGLKDPTGNRLTLVYPGGKMYRISVPFISECPFVTKCLIGLKQVLMKDVAIQVNKQK